jgi:hypothetical protein
MKDLLQALRGIEARLNASGGLTELELVECRQLIATAKREAAQCVRITPAERESLATLSEMIDDNTFLGEGDRRERARWKRGSNTASRLSAR